MKKHDPYPKHSGSQPKPLSKDDPPRKTKTDRRKEKTGPEYKEGSMGRRI